jgi:hypothetical protein
MWLDFVTYLHHHGHNDKLPWYRGKVKKTELQSPELRVRLLNLQNIVQNKCNDYFSVQKNKCNDYFSVQKNKCNLKVKKKKLQSPWHTVQQYSSTQCAKT